MPNFTPSNVAGHFAPVNIAKAGTFRVDRIEPPPPKDNREKLADAYAKGSILGVQKKTLLYAGAGVAMLYYFTHRKSAPPNPTK